MRLSVFVLLCSTQISQIFKQQLDRDDKIRALYESMDSLYALVYDLKTNMDENKVIVQEDVIIEIAKQTTECCYFIRGYASDASFGLYIHIIPCYIMLIDRYLCS